MSRARASQTGHSSTDQPLIVRDVQLREEPPHLVLSCHLDGAGGDVPSTYWLRFPAEFGQYVMTAGDPFLPVILLVAMRQHRRLAFETSVSPTLLEATPRIMELYRDWSVRSEQPLHPVEVTATPVARQRLGTVSGAFFSCGVDSFYTLLRNVARYPVNDSRAIHHLVVVQGFDIALDRTGLYETTRGNAAAVARTLGRSIVPVQTNVKDFLRGLEWAAIAHGAALASVGLVFSYLFHTIYIAATDAFPRLYMKPMGSHPALDPLWSTEAVEFVHDGAETRRVDKVRVIAPSPLALRYLRVCWENRGGAYNCGGCGKCMRTMVDLDLCGALERAETFPHAIDLRAIERLHRPPGRGGRTPWLDTLAEARRSGRQELVASIELMLGRSAWTVSRVGRLDAAATHTLARVGVTPERWKALDRLILRGAGMRAVRHLQRRLGR
jgi:hypothetical protein